MKKSYLPDRAIVEADQMKADYMANETAQEAGSLLLHVATAKQAAREREAKGLVAKAVKFWFVPEGFTSPNPDRTKIISITSMGEATRTMGEIVVSDDASNHFLLEVPESLIPQSIRLAELLELPYGYISNFGSDSPSTLQFMANAKKIDAGSIVDVFEPLSSFDKVEQDIMDSATTRQISKEEVESDDAYDLGGVVS